jgi:fatty aldehyde decarbonylase
METVLIKEAQFSAEYKSVFADILSQAVTGEIIGMSNFATLANIHTDLYEVMEAVEHADNERGHAVAFSKAAEELGVKIIVDIKAPYWYRIRSAFLKWAGKGDIDACMLIQEVMLESFAVSMYNEVGRAAHKSLGELFLKISDEEKEHLDHAVDIFHTEYRKDPSAFTEKVHEIHNDVMFVLAEMVAKKDPSGHCGLCSGECAKDSLHHVNLNIVTMRGLALNYYLKSLDRIGLPGEKTLQWVAQLPV